MAAKGTILVVDDQELNLTLLNAILAKKYNILEARNGLKAVTIVENNRDSIDLILLDIIMPVMDGFDTIKRLKELSILGKIPIILISTDCSKENVVRGFDYGITDVIKKPFDPYLVVERVEHTIAEHKKWNRK